MLRIKNFPARGSTKIGAALFIVVSMNDLSSGKAGRVSSNLPHGLMPLWYSGQSSRLQIQRSGFDSRRYQIF
jgi:hypothetical protein